MNTSYAPKVNNYHWRTLYISGAMATLLVVLIFRRNWSAELFAFNGFGIFDIPNPLPGNALEWFKLLQKDLFVGLSLLNLFDLINFVLVGFIFLAVGAALWRSNRSLIAISLIAGLLGVAVHLSANHALEMFSLSKQYAAATSAQQRAILLTAGDVLLVTNPHDPAYQPTGVHIGLFLVLLAGLLISIVMLRSGIFSKTAAVCGLLANGIALGGFFALVTAPAIYWIFPTTSAPFRMIWYVLIAITLFNLPKASLKMETP